MRELQHVVDTRTVNGKLVNIVRNFFVYEPQENIMAKAHKYFSKDDKKLAKARHKLSLAK